MKHRLSLLLVIVFCSILSVGYSVNNGVFLDGAGDYVSIPTTTRLDSGMSGASGLTVEAWINPTTLSRSLPFSYFFTSKTAVFSHFAQTAYFVIA